MTRGAVTSLSGRLMEARAAFEAVGLDRVCDCSIAPMRAGGGLWFALHSLDQAEHVRRLQMRLGAVTDTGLLHALWALPEHQRVEAEGLSEEDTTTLDRHGQGHVVRVGSTVERIFRPAATIRAVAAAATRLESAVRTVARLPPIYPRIAIAPRRPGSAYERILATARASGVGVVSTDGIVTSVRSPFASVLGVPAVYRWYVAELAYRNRIYADCAHCNS